MDNNEEMNEKRNAARVFFSKKKNIVVSVTAVAIVLVAIFLLFLDQ